MPLDLNGKRLKVLIIGNVGVDGLPDYTSSIVAVLLAPFLVLSLNGGDLLQQGEKRFPCQPLILIFWLMDGAADMVPLAAEVGRVKQNSHDDPLSA